MGRELVTARIKNMEDLHAVELGLLTPDQVRCIEVTDALVDTGATILSLTRRLIDQLGLRFLNTKRVRTAGGFKETNVFGTVKLTIQGRDCPTDVLELPDDCPVLIGRILLHAMDWVVDPVGQKLIGNPEHGGEQMYELFGLGFIDSAS